jgi:acyl dehydratase
MAVWLSSGALKKGKAATAAGNDSRKAGLYLGRAAFLQAHRPDRVVANSTSGIFRYGSSRYSGSMKTFQTLAELAACTGQEVAVSDWLTITQQQVNRFADATGDHQWIHVDPERAAAGPFGATIAHGFLTLSLLPAFFDASMEILGSRMGVNYGLNKVRFMAPVRVGSRLRARMKLLSAEPIGGEGLQLAWEVTVELEGSDKPVCVAESLVRRYP